jgi:glutamate 5-kinase
MATRIVLKLGTSSICDEETQRVRLGVLSQVVETVMRLRSLGHAVVLVSSGAIGVGMHRMNLSTRPSDLAQKQVRINTPTLTLRRRWQPSDKAA